MEQVFQCIFANLEHRGLNLAHLKPFLQMGVRASYSTEVFQCGSSTARSMHSHSNFKLSFREIRSLVPDFRFEALGVVFASLSFVRFEASLRMDITFSVLLLPTLHISIAGMPLFRCRCAFVTIPLATRPRLSLASWRSARS